MSSLTDQQLRAELLQYGETVPPITNRNRQDLLARLEILRARPKRSTRASPVRGRTSAAASSSGPSRSRPVPGLIELSDSDTDAPVRPTSQRSIQVVNSPSSITGEVEQSLARHRREIEQMINAARERALAANSSISSSTPVRSNEPITTPFRSTSSSSSSSSSAFPRSRTTNVETERKTAAKPPSAFQRTSTALRTFWTQNRERILNILKALLLGILFGGTLILAKNFLPRIIPNQIGITCTGDNATLCPEMVPMVDAVREFLEVRAGEVDCGFRPKKEQNVPKYEIQKFLNNKGYKFEEGDEARWNVLIQYIWDKPEDDILVLTKNDEAIEQNVTLAAKLKSEKAIRPLTCRLRKTFHTTVQHLALITLGTSGILSLIWYFKRRANQNREKENSYKAFVDDILQMLENQYEEHLRDPTNTHPWLAISHIRDMLIPVADRKKMKELWQRAQKQISESESRVRAETQVIHGEEFEVWRWIQPKASSSPSSPRKKRAESPTKSNEESYVYVPTDVGLTECLKLRNFFDSEHGVDDDEIDLVVDSIQNRCATVRRIEHIGIHTNFVYLKFSSKEAASQGFHLLNNWRYNGRDIIAKYLRLPRYYDHFPEARDSGSANN